MRLAVVVALMCGGCATRLLTPPDFGSAGSNDDLAAATVIDDLGVSSPADLLAPKFVRIHTAVSCHVAAIATADLDGDGHGDLALACNTDGSAGTIVLLLGNGDGTFKVEDLGPGAPLVDFEHVVTGDINGDGRADVVATSAGHSVFWTLTTNPLATQLRDLSGAPSGLALATLDGNGTLDLVTAIRAGHLEYVLGNGHGIFPFSMQLDLMESGLGRLAARDFDGDGKVDVVVGTAEPHVAIIKGDGAGTLTPLTQVSLPIAGAADVLAAGDLDGDQLADIVATGGGSLFMVVNHGGFNSQLVGKANGISDGAIGDVDGDGRPDITVSDAAGATLFVQGANGNFLTPVSVAGVGSISDATAVAVADEDGDHLNDVIVGSNGSIDVFLHAGP